MKNKICQNCGKEITGNGIKYCRDCNYIVNKKETAKLLRRKRIERQEKLDEK